MHLGANLSHIWKYSLMALWYHQFGLSKSTCNINQDKNGLDRLTPVDSRKSSSCSQMFLQTGHCSFPELVWAAGSWRAEKDWLLLDDKIEQFQILSLDLNWISWVITFCTLFFFWWKNVERPFIHSTSNSCLELPLNSLDADEWSQAHLHNCNWGLHSTEMKMRNLREWTLEKLHLFLWRANNACC